MKYQFVKQHSEEDCGAACLAAIAKYYGRTFTLNHIREAVGTGQFGTTLLGLKRGAETLGFNARSVKTSPELLDRMNEAPLPAIIHWKGNHWVVLYGNKGKKCLEKVFWLKKIRLSNKGMRLLVLILSNCKSKKANCKTIFYRLGYK